MPSRRRKRILHIGVGNVYGGVETVMTTLARHRDLCPDLEVEFALCFEGRQAAALRATGAAVHLIREPRMRTFWRARRNLRDILRARQIDGAVFHAPWIYTLLAPAVRAARLPGILIHYDPTDGRRWLYRMLSPGKPTLAIAISQPAAASVPKLFSDVRCETIYVPAELPAKRALSAADRDAVRAELSTTPGAIVILQVGRVRFIGYYDDLPRLLAAADIYCQPNTGSEGFGLTFIEALWAQLPVIGTPLSGVIDILDDECAIIVPPEDFDAVADAIRKLAGDPDLRARMGAAGPARVIQCCDAERQVLRLDEAILAAVEDAAPPSRSHTGTTPADGE